ncbi:MAG TPA: hypothetical protein VLD37_04755 [Candidatus Bilamarchaeum sp.]|nr:hypothetical protein [Candidatus Bilamarchaeum sp.]
MAKEARYGEWAFLAGMILSLLVGIASGFLGSMLPLIYALLALLGLVVGFLNINEKEVLLFLVSTVALLAVFSSLDSLTALLGTTMGEASLSMMTWLSGFFGAFKAFISAAAFIVALKAIYGMARSD